MASFALTTARMIVAKPSVAATARAGSASAVRAPMAAAPTMVHNVRALSQRGFVGIAAPRAFAPRQQRAAFSMEAAAEGGGETAGAEGVKLYVGAFRSVPFSSPDVFNERARASHARGTTSRALHGPDGNANRQNTSFRRRPSIDRRFNRHL